MRSKKSYVAFETLISVAINTTLSAGFVYLVFHRQTLIPATGAHGVVVDMVPQTFMVILMSFLVPSILTRRRRLKGALSWHVARSASAPYNIFLWAGLAALIGTSLVLAVSWLILPVLLPGGVSFDSLLLAKAAFGALLAAAVTPWAITKALR